MVPFGDREFAGGICVVRILLGCEGEMSDAMERARQGSYSPFVWKTLVVWRCQPPNCWLPLAVLGPPAAEGPKVATRFWICSVALVKPGTMLVGRLRLPVWK